VNVGLLTPGCFNGCLLTRHDDDDDDNAYINNIERNGLTVTTMSPLLRGLFAALPACAWDIVDQKVTSTYFELLEEQISRDEFIMINDVPLVVSTLGGDK